MTKMDRMNNNKQGHSHREVKVLKQGGLKKIVRYGVNAN